jgi:hypothetical protein
LWRKFPKQDDQARLLEICHKKLPHFEEESYEIAKSFGGFG